MTNKKEPGSTPTGKAATGKRQDPQWANGLKQLYDSVVDEPLPDSFKELLSKLDGDSK